MLCHGFHTSAFTIPASFEKSLKVAGWNWKTPLLPPFGSFRLRAFARKLLSHFPTAKNS